MAIPVEQYYVDEHTYGQFLEEQGLDAGQYLNSAAPLPLVYNRGSTVIYATGKSGNYERQVYTYQFLKSGVETAALRQPQEVAGYFFSHTENAAEDLPGTVAPARDFFLNEEGEGGQPSHPNRCHSLGPHRTGPAFGRVRTRRWRVHSDLPPTQVLPDDGSETSVCFYQQQPWRDGRVSGGDSSGAGKLHWQWSGHRCTGPGVFQPESGYHYKRVFLRVYCSDLPHCCDQCVQHHLHQCGPAPPEFAMLRSVGMTRLGLNRMMNYECLLYGFRALAFGVPLSGLMTVLIYEAVGQAVSSSFQVPWSAVAVAVCSIFAVVFSTMLYAMGRIKRENPIDALKNENT